MVGGWKSIHYNKTMAEGILPYKNCHLLSQWLKQHIDIPPKFQQNLQHFFRERIEHLIFLQRKYILENLSLTNKLTGRATETDVTGGTSVNVQSQEEDTQPFCLSRRRE